MMMIVFLLLYFILCSYFRFITDGIDLGVRVDGRQCLDFRPMEIETGIISHTNGSARLKLNGTDILVGIKVELGEPDSNIPDEGRLLVNVQW